MAHHSRISAAFLGLVKIFYSCVKTQPDQQIDLHQKIHKAGLHCPPNREMWLTVACAGRCSRQRCTESKVVNDQHLAALERCNHPVVVNALNAIYKSQLHQYTVCPIVADLAVDQVVMLGWKAIFTLLVVALMFVVLALNKFNDSLVIFLSFIL
jgi:hypothetical protein